MGFLPQPRFTWTKRWGFLFVEQEVTMVFVRHTCLDVIIALQNRLATFLFANGTNIMQRLLGLSAAIEQRTHSGLMQFISRQIRRIAFKICIFFTKISCRISQFSIFFYAQAIFALQEGLWF